MTSQLDKWNRRMGKAAEGHMLKQEEMKRNAQKTTTEMGAEAASKAIGAKQSTEDVFMVIMRDSMEQFVNLRTNSVDSKMNGVMQDMVMPMMKEEIRTMVREEVRDVIQEELQSAIRGAMAGFTQAMAPMFRNPHIQPSEVMQGADFDEVVEEQPEFKNGLQQLAEQREEEQREYKKPRYAVARVMKCSVCKEEGHNKRSCPSK